MIGVFVFFVFFLRSVSGEGVAEDLPLWITGCQGFQKPTQVDSIKTGNGVLRMKETGSHGWIVFLNEKSGHGAEIQVEELSLDPNADDFLLISKWPLGEGFKQVKLLTGTFKEENSLPKRIRIPNVTSFFLLYNVAGKTKTPSMSISYRRYGSSLDPMLPPTESPSKKKEIVHEVPLRGKPPEDYSDPEFIRKLKEGVREAARRYATAKDIPFNTLIPTEEMVLIHKISFCPFEWPDRDICATMKHSVFISGTRVPEEGIILNYQLTADHLKSMWNEHDFPELQELGITVFQLPPTYSTVGYWILISSLIIISSLVITCIVWKAHKSTATSPQDNSMRAEEVTKYRRPKLKLAKHQRVPTFMFANPNNSEIDWNKESAFRSAHEESFEDVLKPGEPIRNYFGSVLFAANPAFEDDEDKPTESPQKSPLVQTN